jgi:hypothetical protein
LPVGGSARHHPASLPRLDRRACLHGSSPLFAHIPGASPALLHSAASRGFTITVLHIVLGEQAPKWLGIKNPEAVSLWVAVPMYLFHKLTFPLTWFELVHERRVAWSASMSGGEH